MRSPAFVRNISGKTGVLTTPWVIPFILVLLFGISLSVRQLSDPDLGFHLKYGKWIIENRSVPLYDFSTYTVSSHEYTDSHWLFQVFLYSVYKISGYPGLSIFVSLLACTIILLFLIRFTSINTSTIWLLLSALVVLEPRILPRPEMFTYIFLLATLKILEDYYSLKNNRLYLLPLIMLLWTNMHGLFILGPGIILTFLLSSLVKDKTPDYKMIVTFILSTGVCLINPYFIKGFLFPFTLLSRFRSDNIFHHHIAEFRSVLDPGQITLTDVVFLFTAVFIVILWIVNWRKHPIHVWVLVPVTLSLALIAVRNFPLFILTCLPFCNEWINVPSFTLVKPTNSTNSYHLLCKRLRQFLWVLLVLLSLTGIIRVINGGFYYSNRLNCKIGLGIDRLQQPEDASDFLVSNGLEGRILNSLGTGGWLSWRITQPVFIDGRLEVIGEDLYSELMSSWNNGLQSLIRKYQPSIILYNYQKYYPWTLQLARMPEWRLVYLDGLFAIFIKEGYASQVSQLNTEKVVQQFGINGKQKPIVPDKSEPQQRVILDRMRKWIKVSPCDSTRILLNAGMFLLQIDNQAAAEMVLAEACRRTPGNDEISLEVLKILKNTNRNTVAESTVKTPEVLSGMSKEATLNFNLGNEKLKQGDIEAAIVHYTRAIQLNPGYYKAYLNRGNAFAGIEHYSEALTDFDLAIEIDPFQGDAFLGKGSCYYFLGRKEEACLNWQKAYKLGNEKAKIMLENYCR